MRKNEMVFWCVGLVVTLLAGPATAQSRSVRAVQNTSTENASDEQAQQIAYKGKVVDDQGQPIADAKVSFHEIAYSETAYSQDAKLVEEVSTKADGMFSFSVAAESEGYRQGVIIAEKQGLAIGWGNWDMRQDKQEDLRLGEPKDLSGLVVDEDGRPVEDAQVSVSFALAGEGEDRRYLASTFAPKLLTVKTDTSGKFTFGNLPADATFELMAKKAGRATTSTFRTAGYQGGKLQFTVGQPDIKVVVPVEARIEGTVVETSGKPVAGVKLIVLDQQRGLPFDPQTVVSKEDGTFSMDSLAASKYVLQVVPQVEGLADWIADQVEVTTEAAKTASNVKVELSKGGVLEVLVREAETKQPIEKARLSVRDEQNDKWLSGRSDKDGVARIRLMPGEYQIRGVYKEKYRRESRQETLTIEDGQTTHVEWLLTGQPKMTGVVRDETGQPVAGVKFKVLPSGHEETASDSQGRFERSWDPERLGPETTVHYLVARHKERNLAAAVEVDENTKEIDVKLVPGVVFTGKVLDPEGKSIAGAGIRVMLHASNWGSTIESRETKTNEEGNFEVKALPPEHRYDVTAMAEGYGEKEVQVEADDAVGNRLDVGQLELAVADLSVSGVVVDAEDKPVSNAYIYCHGDGQPNRNTRTDTEGKFTLEKICDGRIRINADLSGKTHMYGSVETEGGATEVKIVISESSSGSRFVPKRPPSLVSKALPELKDLGIELSPDDTQGKMMLVCFWDMQQRPSRHCIRQLAQKAAELKEKSVSVVAVQASGVDEKTLHKWAEKYDIPFQIGMVKGDAQKSRFAWGVRSLPWLILTNSEHVVTAEGFAVSELDNKIREMSDEK